MSNKFVIAPESLDFNDILADIDAYIEAAPESARWKDKYNNSAGTIIKEIVAGNALFKRREALIARRETFWQFANTRSSAIGGAQYKGYSVFRGQNPRVDVTLTPSFTGTLKKLDAIGLVIDQDLVLLEDTAFIAGQQITVRATIGQIKEEVIVVPDARPNAFRFTRGVVSEDVTLLLNGDTLDISKFLVDVQVEKFALITNPLGSVDVFYTNNPEFTVRYGTGDQLTLRYVNLGDVTFTPSQVELTIGSLSSVVLVEAFRDEEDIRSIKVNAPVFSETQYVVRAREDYLKIFRLLRPEIISTSYINVSPMVIRLFYVREDGILYSPSEVTQILEELSIRRNMGLEPPVMGNAVRAKLKLSIEIKTFVVNGSLVTNTNAILDDNENILGGTIDFELIENKIEDLDDVKVARVKIDADTWLANTRYEAENYVKPTVSNGLVYRVDEVLRLSGSSEPTWPVVLDDEIIDGELVWRCKYLERQCDPFNPLLPLIPPRPVWSANTSYKLGDIVIPSVLGIFEYELVGFVNLSSGTEPVWPALGGNSVDETIGEEVLDARLIWRAIELVGTPNAWSPTTNYQIGDLVVATNPSSSDTVGLMFQLIGIVGVSSGVEPAWPIVIDDFIIDGTIRWQARLDNVSPRKLAQDRYLKIERTITLL